MQSDTKTKVTFGKLDLSAFLVSTLAQGLQLKNSTVAFNAKADASRPQIMNVELVVGGSNIYGEITVCDYLVGVKNAQEGNRALTRQGQNLNYDDLLHSLNTKLRPAVSGVINSAKRDEPLLTAFLARLESQTLNAKEFGILQAMVFAYVEPVRNFAGERVSKFLQNLEKNFSLQSFEQFVANKGANPGASAAAEKKGKDVKIAESNAKLVRLNKGEKILPKKGRRNILITSALPYVNNVPHLGNIIGCVLSADVYARFARLRGYNAIYVCGTDEYGTATETKALQEGLSCQQICDKYHKIHKRIYEWFDCDTDLFGRTSTKKQTEITQEIFLNLQKEGKTMEQIVEQQYCNSCEHFLADRFVSGTCPMCQYPDAKGDQCDGCGKLVNAIELIDPRCRYTPTCTSTPVPKKSKHIFIDLAQIQPELQQWVEKQATDGGWSDNATFFTNNLLKEGLHERCITRDLKWGTPIPHPEYKDKVFYVWFDAPIGYISITGNYLGAENDDYKKWWQNPEEVELYQFMGKDNTTFHTVIFPSTLIGSKMGWTLLNTISTTEWLNYEIDEATGKPKKFSKTRGVGIFGDDAESSGIASEVWRYYLLANRPEQQDSVFLWSDFVAKNNNELLKNLGNFTNRILKFLASSFEGKVPAYEGDRNAQDDDFIASIYAKFEEFLGLMEDVKLKDALRVTMAFSSLCNTYMQETAPWVLAKKDKVRCGQVVNTALQAMNLLAAQMEPFMPSFSAKVYEQMALKRTATHEKFFEFIAGHPERIQALLPAGHQIGSPAPIFSEISQEQMQAWKVKYGGVKDAVK